MHELSLCRSIYDIAARASAGRTVTDVRLDVGKLRQVVPETLTYCWGIVTEATPLAGSALRIDHIDAVIACRACDARTVLEHVPIMVCGQCGGTDVEVLSGEEFLLRSLDVKD